MGWYVEKLLLERDKIKANIFESTDIPVYDEEEFEGISIRDNLESDLHLDLIEVERKIKELLDKKLLTDYEIMIINAVITGISYSSLAKELDISRVTIAKEFRGVCDKIAYYLGDHFTDEGYQEYMRDKYNLTEEDMMTVSLYMNGEFRKNR